MTRRARLLRTILRWFGLLVEKLLTRTTVTGLENLPAEGAFIFAANHASTYDPVVFLTHLPFGIRTVGPGDFPLLFPANLVVKYLDVIQVQRGAADRDSLKQMMEVLKSGQMLALFPEGGTWEKRLDDVKPGAAYLSLMTGAPIVPVAIGGTYQVWKKIILLRRPRITIHIAPPMPPVTNSDRKNRQADLDRASQTLMQIIYQHLPPAEQARYDLHARQQFRGVLESSGQTPLEPSEGSFEVLAELVSKPNLFSPLYRNLDLPLKPLIQTQKFHPAETFVTAAKALQQALEERVPGYLNYRMGDHKAAQALQELAELQALSEAAAKSGLSLCFIPQITIVEQALPPNQ